MSEKVSENYSKLVSILKLFFDQERVNSARRAVCRALSGRKQREDSKIPKVSSWMRARKAGGD